MSEMKLIDSTQLDTDLTSVANAIRTKGGTSASLAFPAGFVSAVEAIPTGGSGGHSGEFTPAERTGVYTFYAPGCTYLACIAKTPPSTSTGLAFVYAFVCYVGQYYAAQSTNSGTSTAGANGGVTVTYENDTFKVNFGNVGNTTKVPQVGVTYTWAAW